EEQIELLVDGDGEGIDQMRRNPGGDISRLLRELDRLLHHLGGGAGHFDGALGCRPDALPGELLRRREAPPAVDENANTNAFARAEVEPGNRQILGLNEFKLLINYTRVGVAGAIGLGYRKRV